MAEVIWHCKPFSCLNTNELYKILRARSAVFVEEQNCAYQDLDGFDTESLHLWATSKGQIVAYCRIFAPGVKYNEASIGRVLTTEPGRGTGIGKQLMRFALEIIATRWQNAPVRISAQDYLLKFYGDFGFKDTGKKYLEDNIPHTEMLRP